MELTITQLLGVIAVSMLGLITLSHIVRTLTIRAVSKKLEGKAERIGTEIIGMLEEEFGDKQEDGVEVVAKVGKSGISVKQTCSKCGRVRKDSAGTTCKKGKRHSWK